MRRLVAAVSVLWSLLPAVRAQSPQTITIRAGRLIDGRGGSVRDASIVCSPPCVSSTNAAERAERAHQPWPRWKMDTSTRTIGRT